MAKSISRASLSGAGGDPALRGELPNRRGEQSPIGEKEQTSQTGDPVLKLLHTADWHLGRRFKSFPEDAQKKLSRARMDVVGRILDVARRNGVHAVLCAGDLFDDPVPDPDFWEGLAAVFKSRSAPHPPVFLIPGNHDPLTPESV